MVEQDVENLKIYFDDCFLSTEQFEEKVTGDGYTNIYPTEALISSGIASGSTAGLYYCFKTFNPTYAELVIKLCMNTIKDCVAFWGFKSTIEEPTSTMRESHIGLMVENGKLYFTSANGDNQQKVQITGIDVTKTYMYKITNNTLFIKPLPQIETYLGLPTIKSVKMEWNKVQENKTYPPDDIVHYILFFIKNTAGTERYIRLNRVIYKEDYAD
jgi:hypothetical protein